MSNLPVVQEIYAAFGRGKVAAILERLSESVECEDGATTTAVPWLKPRHGRAGAAEFFAGLAAIEIEKFVPKRLLEDGDVVVALIDLEARVKATGKRVVEEDEVHIWHFDQNHRVTRFRHRVDTQQHPAALTG